MKIFVLRIADYGLPNPFRLKKFVIRNSQFSNRHQEGFVLIWVMLIVLSLFAAASTLAIVMASSLRVAGSIDTGVPAFYAAESCIERAQFYILKQDLTLSNTVKVAKLNQTNPPDPAPPPTPTLGTNTLPFGNGATWNRVSTQCFSDTATPPDPCGIVFVTCLGSFKGTNAGVSARIE